MVVLLNCKKKENQNDKIHNCLWVCFVMEVMGGGHNLVEKYLTEILYS